MKPLLRWAGGKGSLLNDIKNYMPADISKISFHEPFVGGGALFFDIEPKKGTINDINKRLINFYKVVKKSPDKLIAKANEYQKYVQDKEMYYVLREEFNDDKNINNITSAALFLYFNRAGYNGLYRVNSKNQFNVPIGRHSNPTIVNISKIKQANKVLKNIKIHSKDFKYISNEAKEGDFCYFDPPYYQPKINTKFTDYSKDGFSLKDHERLKNICITLNEKGVYFILSNSNAKKIIDMYSDVTFKIEKVTNRWMISCNSATRKIVEEILVNNINIT
jgi:DNA adenine methylase